jgi:hypothetical protein
VGDEHFGCEARELISIPRLEELSERDARCVHLLELADNSGEMLEVRVSDPAIELALRLAELRERFRRETFVRRIWNERGYRRRICKNTPDVGR